LQRSGGSYRRTQSETSLNRSYSDLNDTYGLSTRGFDDLCEWLFSILNIGQIVSLNVIASEYENILNKQQEKVTKDTLRAASIRHRLETRFGDKLRYLTSLFIFDLYYQNHIFGQAKIHSMIVNQK
jgi:hypothetical protein